MRISDWSSDVCSSDLVDIVDIDAHARFQVEAEIILADAADIGEEGRAGPAERAGAFQGDVGRLPGNAGDVGQPLGLERFGRRSEERRVGKGGGSTCRSRGAADN